MSKKLQLKERYTQEDVYPITTTSCVIEDTGENLSDILSTKADKLYIDAELEKTPISEEVIDLDTFENFDKVTKEQLSKDMFIKLWNNRCKYGIYGGGIHGKYNEETGYFELNGITNITFEEAIDIYNIPPARVCNNAYANQVAYSQLHRVRTVFPVLTNGLYLYMQNAFYDCEELEVVRFLTYYNYNSNPDKLDSDSISSMPIYNCTDIFGGNYERKLRRILGRYSDTRTQLDKLTASLKNLEYFMVSSLKSSITFLRENKVFEIGCLQYMIEKAANTTPITITVHANIYSKLLGEGNYSDENGTKEEWVQLNEDAIAKQITFITV